MTTPKSTSSFTKITAYRLFDTFPLIASNGTDNNNRMMDYQTNAESLMITPTPNKKENK